MGNVIKICHLECWSVLINGALPDDANYEDLFKICTFEYGVDVTLEVYDCIKDHVIRSKRMDNHMIKFFYFKKSIREVPEDAYM